jgi:outer membrane lipoprotein-sorting protein
MRRIIVLLGFCVCLAVATDHPIWVSLRSTYLGLKTLSGTFTENICSEDQGTCTEFEGKFAISLPGRYRLEVTEGQKQLFVSDSTNLWIYLADQKRLPRPGARLYRDRRSLQGLHRHVRREDLDGRRNVGA